MVINNNISALDICNNMSENNKVNSKAIHKISSGLRINCAADDSAGLGISQKMKAQIRGLDQDQNNIQDGISLIQTAEGGLAQIENPNLQRMRELAVQASNGTLNSEDREIIQKEIDEIKSGINDIANNTEFNGIKVLRPPISKTPPTTSGNADIVFVVDNTGSMSGIQTTVANNITNLINSITSQGVTDVRMGLVEYKDSTINNFDFAGSKWTSNTSDIATGFLTLAANNSGGTENAMQALTEASNYYDFRSNDNGNQTKHIIFITDEDADDDVNLPSTLSSMQSNGIQVSGVYHTTNSDVSEFNTLTSSTGGLAVNLSDANWGDQLSSVLGSNIGASAGTTVEDDKMQVVNLQIGTDAGDIFKVELFDSRTANLGVDDILVDPVEEAEKAISKIDQAIGATSAQRAKFGAYQNVLGHINNSASNTDINLNSAVSRIEDADIAKEVMEMTTSSILQQAAQNLLSQANKMPESIVNLMKQWGQS